MQRRSFLYLAGAAALPASAAASVELFVSPVGDDRNPGTKARPLATWAAARDRVRARRSGGPVTAWFRGGVYYLPETLVLGAADSGTQAAPVTYAAYPGEEVVLSGGVKLQLEWTPFRDGILMARVPAALDTDQLFVNGRRQILARYPNYDAASQYFNGWSPDAFSKERAAGWKDPRGGFLHAMHRSMWGDFHYRITGKDAAGNLTYEGGWQNNRPMGMHDKYRFVENVFEELDAPGEWFLDRAAHVLYFYPPPGIDLSRATVEAVRLRHLVELRGSEAQPVHWITLRGFTFRHAARTFMETREPLLRSDWTIYRGGALFLTGAADCAIEECIVDQVGGNAIFVSGFNRRVAVRRAHVVAPGATAVAFVGEASAVRSPLFEVNRHQALSELDPVPGPRSNTYPADCLLEDSLLHEIGRVEKQTAGVEISMAQGITVRRCSIYDAPRAGINISEGTWGGHLIEFCDVFDTVKETGDHGAFNSWGRDRYWQATGIDLNALGTGALHELPVLDAVKPTTLRNNRWRCDHGWDIDLDDGSTNYRIENNLALNGGIKLREGFYRTVQNNIMVRNSFHPHVWFPHSQDVFRRNIVFTAYKPIRVPKPWGEEVDFNLLQLEGATEARSAVGLQNLSGRDQHSLEADAQFVNPAGGDYRVRPGSPALTLGFRNFAMDQFGVQWPRLKSIARTPELPRSEGSAPATLGTKRDARIALWLGATVRNVTGLGEVSAAGLPGETGVLVLEVPPQSRAASAGLRVGDVVLKLEDAAIVTLADLERASGETPPFGEVRITIYRGQRDVVLRTESPIR